MTILEKTPITYKLIQRKPAIVPALSLLFICADVLIHGLFHNAFVISPRLISSLGLKPSGPISRSRADNKGNMQKAMY
jgi:hypothetical protein